MKNATLLLLLVMAFMDVHGQIPEPPKSMISPTASSLGLYGEIIIMLHIVMGRMQDIIIIMRC